jgi:hypothetical protein
VMRDEPKLSGPLVPPLLAFGVELATHRHLAPWTTEAYHSSPPTHHLPKVLHQHQIAALLIMLPVQDPAVIGGNGQELRPLDRGD